MCDTVNGLFTAVVIRDDESVAMTVNSAIDLGHIFEQLYTCRCDFSEGAEFEGHFLLVSNSQNV